MAYIGPPSKLIRRQNILATDEFSIAWPPATPAPLTIVNGVANLTLGPPPPPVGTLDLSNIVDTSQNAWARVTAFPSTIANSDQTLTYGNGLPQTAINVMGLFARASFNPAVSPYIVNGYRSDIFNNLLRLVRFDAGAGTLITSLDLTTIGLPYYTVPTNPAAMRMRFSGFALSTWLTAPGQPSTPVLSANLPNTLSYPVGFIGFFGFRSLGGASYVGRYQATFSL